MVAKTAIGNRIKQLHRGLRRLLALLLASLMMLSNGGCSLEQFEKPGVSNVEPLVFSTLSDPKTFNPVLNQEYPNVFLYTYEGLTGQDGTTGEIIPKQAESWDMSEDGKTIVFTLRPNLKWSDGEPLTAADVVFTYNEVVFNEEIPTSNRDVMRIGEAGLLPEVVQLDERRIQFNLPEPFAPLLRTTSMEILPAHILRPTLEERDADGNLRFLSTWGTDTPPAQVVSNGPYRIKAYYPAERVVFERNPYYWQQDDQGRQQPYIQELIWQVVESSDTQVLQFRSGGLDLISVAPDFFALLKREEERGNFTIYNGGPALGTNFLCFNLNQGTRNGEPLVDPVRSQWFNTLEFRQAVSYAIDRQAMINNIFQGLGEVQTSPISVQSPYYAPPEAGIPTYDYNLDKAKSLLAQAGFQTNARGELEDSDGNRVNFTLITNAGNKIRESIAAQIKQDLDKLGIEVNLQPIAFNTLVSKLSDSLDWEAHVLGLTGGLEPNNGANVWLLNGSLHVFNQQALSGQQPIAGWQAKDWEAKIAQLYIQAAQEPNEAKRQAIYRETQRLTQTHLPFIYLINPLSLGAVRNTIDGIRYSAIGGALWNLEALTIED
ncbi:putative ABC transporter-binding protein [Halomicronema hongdechloris C2206]|uniref:ABC transporter-binding protein n=1 Tax=Halomicronema hongdechloris C2206 TaxID=1641165 RepID=A0A1Z3HLW7_9CYAN|nr:ABC transporter substrate-binding protein [Halomicronema hongdechloris]ASC71288.1 putative ABC transporter-binding protein [Halomicronema hongdechloris C2206]